jgi:hypothetical protein
MNVVIACYLLLLLFYGFGLAAIFTNFHFPGIQKIRTLL